MSEIKITIVMDDEKLNSEKQGEQSNFITLTQESSMTVMSVLREKGLLSGSFCGGRGDCGCCVVQFLEGAPLPTGIERSRLEPEELRLGYRLACVTRPKTDCVIRIPKQDEQEIPIVTEMNHLSENIDLGSQSNKLSENQISIAMDYIVAVDLGTTTIAMQLRDMVTGEVIDTYCELNPQRSYGTDVLSRIQASCDGHRKELQRLVCEVLLRGLRQFFARVEILETASGDAEHDVRPACMCIAGNTTMEHLLLGYDVSTLGRSPFTPVEIGLQEMMVSKLFAKSEDTSEETEEALLPAGWDFPVYIAPGISAFVGGDIVAGLYTLQMLPNGPGFQQAEEKAEMRAEMQGRGHAKLLVDLGTNGEIALTDGRCLLVTATAAGPAFEGGKNSTLIGTDRIALTAELLRQGILDETGLLAEPYFSEGVSVEVLGESASGQLKEMKKNRCYLKQEDIRDLQMAKAAIRAGVEILWEKMGCPEIGTVYLAGGFGYYLDVEAALAIGLLPERLRGCIRAVGNTALEGAYRLGRDLAAGILTKSGLEEALAVTENGRLHAVNLAKQEGFEELYIKYMNLERN